MRLLAVQRRKTRSSCECLPLPPSQVDYMTSQLSYFHLGHITVKDAEPHINELYGVLEVGSGQALHQSQLYVCSCAVPPSCPPEASCPGNFAGYSAEDEGQVSSGTSGTINYQLYILIRLPYSPPLLSSLQVFLSRSRDLVLFHSQDLHFPLRTAKANIM